MNESRLIVQNARQLVTTPVTGSQAVAGKAMADLTILEDASLVVEDGIITWIGPTRELLPVPGGPELSEGSSLRQREGHIIDASGKVVLPGLVDSHTHLVFAGTRENEFEQRLQGKTYQEIAGAGGGINATVAKVRAASKEDLKTLARARLARLLSFGVTTVEIKSGYGLNLTDEIKCLEVVSELNALGPFELVPTFLGAHVVPVEFQNDRNGYLNILLDEMLPEIARSRLAEFCDVFCEAGVFSLEESERILKKARDLGFRLKVHADELTPLGGAELAARLGATSADHLLCISPKGIESLARSGTVATLLPGTAFFLGLDYAPARKMIDRGLAVAIASDCNPGTCPSENLPLAGALACAQMRMLPAEAITALTHNGAAALARSDRLGSLQVGKQADLIVCDVPDYRQLFYHFGVNHVWRVVKRGRVVYSA